MARDVDGKMATFDDIYDRDGAVLASFDAPRKANRSRVQDEEIIPLEAPGA
jgi:murein L,D-transpeptidase YcbB/YkuD